ncbi:hypothetical protein SPHV1_2280053 [Novosphingobium sp. KN65.2]|nr:hypothetical protein SPHV1_2280053 [Novosphingobium sp. KN65.2]
MGDRPELVEIADRHFLANAEFARRIGRHKAQCAAGRIPAEQRALRAAQRFDADQVEQVCRQAIIGAHIDAVDVDGNRLVRPWQAARAGDAAHNDLRGTQPARRLAHRNARRHGTYVLQAGDAAGGQFLLPDHGDGNRHILKILLAFLRGDDDLVDADILGLGYCKTTGHCRGEKEAEPHSILIFLLHPSFLPLFSLQAIMGPLNAMSYVRGSIETTDILC